MTDALQIDRSQLEQLNAEAMAPQEFIDTFYSAASELAKNEQTRVVFKEYFKPIIIQKIKAILDDTLSLSIEDVDILIQLSGMYSWAVSGVMFTSSISEIEESNSAEDLEAAFRQLVENNIDGGDWDKLSSMIGYLKELKKLLTSES